MLAIAKRTLTALTVIGILLTVPASAFAECGPGFSNKHQLIQIVKENPSIAHGMRRELLAEPKSKYAADETVLNYIRESDQQVRNAPSGYVLTSNTYCPGGYGDYHPYPGLLGNMGGKPMLWHCEKGHNCIPLLKGYCMNFVHGPPIRKHHKPHKPKCKCRKHKHHKKPPPAKVCSGNTTNQNVGTAAQGGNCSTNTNVTVCSAVNSPGSVVCSETPCACKEAEAPKIKNVYKIQEVRTKEAIQFYADLYAPVGDEVVLTFEAEFGVFTPEKFVVPSYGAQSHFVTTYKAPSEALMDNVCVTALDKTTGKEAVPQCQLVEVQATPEPPA